MTRNGVIESQHAAHAVVTSPGGTPVAVVGDPATPVYGRSAFKPLQAAAVQACLAEHDRALDARQLAIASASHTGSYTHQLWAADILAAAGLDERALGCPPAWPGDAAARSRLARPTSLSHNCSGKHAAMLWAHTAGGGPAAGYLDPSAGPQQRIAEVLSDTTGEAVSGPGVDGCGAPAWRCSLGGLARGFARLVAGAELAAGVGLAAIRDAMIDFPHLVGGEGIPDTMLMSADGRVVAKRGAEGVMAAGFGHPTHGPVGVAVKIVDGGNRAASPLTAAVLRGLGATVEEASLRPAVLGGGRAVGTIEALPTVAGRISTVWNPD